MYEFSRDEARSLDEHITGHYGEDMGDLVTGFDCVCPSCGLEQTIDSITQREWEEDVWISCEDYMCGYEQFLSEWWDCRV